MSHSHNGHSHDHAGEPVPMTLEQLNTSARGQLDDLTRRETQLRLELEQVRQQRLRQEGFVAALDIFYRGEAPEAVNEQEFPDNGIVEDVVLDEQGEPIPFTPPLQTPIRPAPKARRRNR